nr:ABC transporter ATP-binding protein [Streptococcus equi]
MSQPLLDIKYQLDILALIKKINQELGMTIIMVLHDINQALAVSDCVLGLQKGAIYAQGSPQEVLDQAFVEAVFGVSLPLLKSRIGDLFLPLYETKKMNDR